MPSNDELVDTFECAFCSHRRPTGQINEDPRDPSHSICDGCLNDYFQDCDDCGETRERSEMWDTVNNGESHVCDACYNDSYATCHNCDETHHRDTMTDDLCSSCYADEVGGSSERSYDTSDKYVEPGLRPYSVEIECVAPDYTRLEAAASAIPTAVGFLHDGSINEGDGIGRELVTPKLSGTKGKELLKTVCSELVKNKFKVNASCGLHAHIDTSEYKNNLALIKILFQFYLAFEPVIFSYLPMSRRKNTYCLPLSEFYHAKEVASARDQEVLEAIWYREQSKEKRENIKAHKYHESRYAGINFHSLFSHHNIEIRYHSGTIDHNKIDMWIKLHVAIIDRIAQGYINTNSISEVKYIIDMEGKQKLMFDLLDLPANVKEYFVDRQKKFGVINSTNKNICAE